MRVVPDTKQPQYVIDDLQLDDTDAIDGAAALLVEVFPHWLPTMENARDEVMEALGMSRVTARRYLEYLADAGTVSRTARYGTPGRPENEYRWSGR